MSPIASVFASGSLGRRPLALFALAAVAVFGAGACGDDGGDSATGPDSAYCKQLKKTADEALNPKNTTTSSSDKNAAAKAQEDQFNQVLDDIVDEAPEELEDDYAAFKEFVSIRFELIKNPELAKTDAARITAAQEKYTPAAKAISDYNNKVCQFQTTTTAVAPAATTTAPK